MEDFKNNVSIDGNLDEVHSENVESSVTSDVEVMEDLKDNEKSRIVIVTGMSGGGKTQACRYLEDLGSGFYTKVRRVVFTWRKSC